MLPTELCRIDAGIGRQATHRFRPFLIGKLLRQDPVDFIERLDLRRIGRAVEGHLSTRRRHAQRITVAVLESGLDQIPPRLNLAVGQPRCDVDSKRRAVPFENRQRFDQIVAETVFQRDSSKTLATGTVANAVDRLVDRNE